jgi:HSP20 family protein
VSFIVIGLQVKQVHFLTGIKVDPSGKNQSIIKSNQEDPIMTIIRYAPRPRFTDIFDNMFEREADHMQHRNCGCLPKTNIIEKEDNFLLELAVPGMKKDDFRINLEKELLTISSETEKKETDDRYTMQEFETGAFSRSFIVPKTVDTDAIKADYEHGILTVTLPIKKEEVKISKEILIN